MRYLLGGLASVGMLAQAASAQDRIELEPASSWVMNYDDDSCALQRMFGEDGGTFLEIRQFGPRAQLQIIVASKDFDVRRSHYEVTFEPVDQEPTEFERFNIRSDDEHEGKLFAYSLEASGREFDAAMIEFVNASAALTSEQKDLVVRSFGLESDSDEMERIRRRGDYQVGSRLAYHAFRQTELFAQLRDQREDAVNGIYLTRAFAKPIFLKTGALHAPMEAMRSGLDELMSHWGIDIEAHRSLSREVLPVDFEDWSARVRASYPSQMIREGYEGYVITRLDISKAGEVIGCHIQSPINNDAFERTACEQLAEARFSPALDAEGQPIDSYYQLSVVYVLS